jgi:hypothetical protein
MKVTCYHHRQNIYVMVLLTILSGRLLKSFLTIQVRTVTHGSSKTSNLGVKKFTTLVLITELSQYLKPNSLSFGHLVTKPK